MDTIFPTSQPPNLSYWEIETYLANIDLLIIGSGIVGLTTAIYSKQSNPNLKIAVIERGSLPSGGSTKNAGFACFGSASELLADLQTQSESEVFERVAHRIEGLKLLRNLIGDDVLGYENCGGFELFTPQDEAIFNQCLSFIANANVQLGHLTGLTNTYEVADQKIAAFGFEGVTHLIHNKGEGALHTGKMMHSLTQKAQKLGIFILTGLGVKTMSENINGATALLDNGHELRSGHIHIATNGFAQELLPELDVKPARAQVLITSPITNLNVNGTFHLEEGYYYFRNVGNRILLGGGRNLDFVNETTSKTGLTELVQDKLEELLRTTILPNMEYSIAHRWSGVMGLGKTKDTLVQPISAHITCAVRMGGMGVALGASIGKKSAELIFGQKS
jgi:gamma-glutamylputrescine oxidase